MSTANIITLSRIALIPICIFFMKEDAAYAPLAACGIFALASITDSIDGYVARKFNQITTFGKFIDPLADKLLVTAAMLVVVEQGIIPAVAAIIIIAREFCVTSLRIIGMGEKLVIAAGWSGKVKTATQMIGICILLLAPYIIGIIPAIDRALLNGIVSWTLVVVTVYSGIDYFYQYRSLFKGSL